VVSFPPEFVAGSGRNPHSGYESKDVSRDTIEPPLDNWTQEHGFGQQAEQKNQADAKSRAAY